MQSIKQSIMKYRFSSIGLLVFLTLQIALTSCNSSTSSTTLPGSWEYVGAFSGYPRASAVSFTINGVAYVGGGVNFDAVQQGISANGRLNDFWKYDPVTGWKRVADFPGTARSQAVAFSLNGKGYVGTGNDGTYALSDFYQFDPNNGAKGTWTKINDFGFTSDQGSASVTKRYGSVAFTVNDGVKDRAFVGGGYFIGALNDFWEYDDTNNVWIQRPDIAGSKRLGAFAMVINNIAYVGGGTSNNQYNKDFWAFDVKKLDVGPWIKLNGLTGKDANGNAITQPRSKESACTFTIDGKGYLACGNAGAPTGDIWQYDPSLDSWTQYFSFTNNVDPVSGSSRSGAVSFSQKATDGITYGYVVTGGSGSSVKFDDFWKFNPNGLEPDNK